MRALVGLFFCLIWLGVYGSTVTKDGLNLLTEEDRHFLHSLPIEEHFSHLRDITNPIQFDASDEDKLLQIEELSVQNEDLVDNIVKKIDKKLGTFSKWGRKLPDRIVAKAYRANILKAKPWHKIEHVRDCLRFKTRLEHIDQIKEALHIIALHNISFVKVDVNKLLHPKLWGWRFIAFDLRFPNGQLVEYYLPPFELDVKPIKGPNHVLYEKWRLKTSEEIHNNWLEFWTDAGTSWDAYNTAWLRAVNRMGFDTTQDLEKYWKVSVAPWLPASHCPRDCRTNLKAQKKTDQLSNWWNDVFDKGEQVLATLEECADTTPEIDAEEILCD